MTQLPITQLHRGPFLPRPITITVGNTKGGVAKTTTAVNLAIAATTQHFLKTALIDADPQHSAVTFTNARAEALGDPLYTCVPMLGKTIPVQAPRLAADHHLTIIDAGGRDNSHLRMALLVSDAVLIPVAPRALEMWALDDMVELLADVRAERNPDLKAYAFLSLADARGPELDAAAAMIRETEGVDLLDAPIRQRKAWPRATAEGRGVVEYRPRDKGACEDLDHLMTALFDRARADVAAAA